MCHDEPFADNTWLLITMLLDIDDAESECGLDDEKFDFTLQNNGKESTIQLLSQIEKSELFRLALSENC